MSGLYEIGYDSLPTSFTGAQVQAVLEMEGWYTYGSTTIGTSFLSIGAPGRYGYGRQLQWRFFGSFQNHAPYGLVRPLGYHNTAGLFVSTGYNFLINGGAPPVLGAFDAVANAFQCSVSFEANGVVNVWRGPPGTANGGVLLANSEAGQFDIGVDLDIEVHFKVDPSAGDVEVRIDQVAVVHAINVNTQATANAGCDSYFKGLWVGPSALDNVAFNQDDFRVYDTVGSINNTWLGTRRVQELIAAADGATLDFTRSNTGLAHWQNIINENVDDTLYLYDPTVGDFNLSTPTPLVNSPDVAWLGMAGYYRQDDATQRTVKNRIISSGVTADGAAFQTAQTYSCDHDVFELDPATGVQFTGAAVNALSFGPLVYA